MTVSKKIAGAVAAVALSLGAMTATAQAEDKLGYTVSIVGVSDYMFRGISFTEEDPAFQPFVEFTYNIFYLDFWGSNIDSGSYGPWELDMYLGMRPVTGPISWDFAIWYYQYGSQAKGPGALSSEDLDYVEFKAAGTVSPLTNTSVTLTAYYAPDQDAASAETWSFDALVAYTLPTVGPFTPTISGQVGWFGADFAGGGYFQGEANEYWYWNGGVKLTVDKFFMDLRYWDTELNADFADERFVFTAGVNLP